MKSIYRNEIVRIGGKYYRLKYSIYRFITPYYRNEIYYYLNDKFYNVDAISFKNFREYETEGGFGYEEE